MNVCFQANILAVWAVKPRLINLAYTWGPSLMGWVVSLSDMDLSTHALTAVHHFQAFGVCQELVGGEAPASNQ